MDFTDIQAYEDEHVNTAIHAILENKDFKNIIKQTSSVLKTFNADDISSVINSFKNIRTVKGFQNVMFTLLKQNLKETTGGLSYSGEDNVKNDNKLMFISNHRSTSLDAAYLNFILNDLGLETAYSGAGDNIFETEWLGHLIRLNKGFIIKRNVEDIDKKIEEAVILSGYINSLLMQNKSVWISQQPGRAKTGLDKTDSVVITMLHKFNDDKNYEKWLNSISLIPVCISWEIIPCAEFMVDDLLTKNKTKSFADRTNILHEITSYKGRVHYHFGKRVTGKKRGEIVKAIDNEILSNYRLWESNWYAYLKKENLSKQDKTLIENNVNIEKGHDIFNNYSNLTQDAVNALYTMYATPVEMALERAASLENLIEINKNLLNDITFVK